MAGVEHLVGDRATPGNRFARIERIDGIALDLGNRRKTETLVAQQRHEPRKHESGEVGFMQEEHVRNFVTEGDNLLFAPKADEFRGVFHVTLLKPFNARMVVFDETATVRIVPIVILEIERHLGNVVAIPQQPAANGFTFLNRIAFFEIRVAKPVPVSGGTVSAEGRLVDGDVVYVSFSGGVVECGMGKRVIADLHSGGKPEMERLLQVRVVTDAVAIHEPIDAAEMVSFKFVDEPRNDADTGLIQMQAAGGGNIVESERHHRMTFKMKAPQCAVRVAGGLC